MMAMTEKDIIMLLTEAYAEIPREEMLRLASGYVEKGIEDTALAYASGGFLAGIRWALEHLAYETENEMQ